MYKKRPIYWMFSSKKGHFNALIYLHRYTFKTPQNLFNNHFNPTKTKLLSIINTMNKQSTQTKIPKRDFNRILKEINALNEILQDLNDFEHHVLQPLILNPPSIDLDEGIVINSQKFKGAFEIL